MPEAPFPIHEHALENLRVIRETMERAGSFTSIPGWGGLAIGISAIGAAAVAQRAVTAPHDWLTVWLIEAGIAAIIGAVTMAVKWRRTATPFMSGAARRFFVSYFAPLIAGAILTFVLAHRGAFDSIPAVWLFNYFNGRIEELHTDIDTIKAEIVDFLMRPEPQNASRKQDSRA